MTPQARSIEHERIVLQERLDSQKTQQERNRLGQFATPTSLALDILSHARALMPDDAGVRFLDPAIGTGAFYSALRAVFPEKRIEEGVGFEIDPHYGAPSIQLWDDAALSIKLADFTRQEPQGRFSLLVCNPPYVRHHHLSGEEKARLQAATLQASGIRLSGLAGLYCHFVGLSHAWLADEALSIWLIPSEFMDVNYGRALKRYLLETVTLLQMHRFDPADVQFADALVSSAVVCFRNAAPPAAHEIRFTFGGTLQEPHIQKTVPAAVLARERKWTRFPISEVRQCVSQPRIFDFFTIKRGIATGSNSYFILSEEEIEQRRLPHECFRPILPSPRYLSTDQVNADSEGVPKLNRRLFLLDTKISEPEIADRFPALFAYLQEGKTQSVHERYLCRHRAPWYAQEERPPAPIVCTYLGRSDKKNGRPFRFILNLTKATVANVYLAMYPTPAVTQAMDGDSTLLRRIWQYLNELTPEQLLGEGRVYGGGLHKLEPKELANVPAPGIADLLPLIDRAPAQAELLL